MLQPKEHRRNLHITTLYLNYASIDPLRGRECQTCFVPPFGMHGETNASGCSKTLRKLQQRQNKHYNISTRRLLKATHRSLKGTVHAQDFHHIGASTLLGQQNLTDAQLRCHLPATFDERGRAAGGAEPQPLSPNRSKSIEQSGSTVLQNTDRELDATQPSVRQ